MPLPEGFIDELLARIDLVELLQEYLSLRKVGANYVTCCPFHTEKTPSFSVNPRRQRYHCFGCGASGDAIHFLREHQHLEFMEAVRVLASRVGMSVPETSARASKEDKYKTLYEANALALEFFQECLKRNVGQVARDYLQARGVNEQSIEQFALGYAPDRFDALLNYFTKRQVKPEILLTLGLVGRSAKGRVYDKFRHRLMFPIRDKQGRVIGFGGRAFGDAMPKYLNSPQTPLFHKSEVLYGLYEAKSQLHAVDQLVLVEGYMDVIALTQFGISGALASLGTAFTPQHLQRLYRHTSRLVFCFDGDTAGVAAANKAVMVCLPQLQEKKQAAVLMLPASHDPDTLIRAEGAEAFQQRVKNAQDIVEYYLEGLKEKHDINTMAGRSQMIDAGLALFREIQSPVLVHLFVERLAMLTRSSPEILHRALKGQNTQVEQPREQQGWSLKPTSLVRKALVLLLHYPQLLPALETTDLHFETIQPGEQLLLEIRDYILQHADCSGEGILEAWTGSPWQKDLTRLYAQEPSVNQIQAQEELAGIFQQFQQNSRDKQIEYLMKKLSTAGLSESERADLTELLRNKSAGNLSKTVEEG